MKTFKQFKSELCEGISDVLYHSTYGERAANILRTNRFVLSVAVDSASELSLSSNRKKLKFFFLSTSRSKTGAFQQSMEFASEATTFVLDGRKLASNLSGSPIDYFKGTRETKSAEAEDRIYSDKPEINNAAKYIKEIHIRANTATKNNKNLATIARIAKEKNIPLYLYTDGKDFVVQNKSKAITDHDKIVATLDSKEKEPPVASYEVWTLDIMMAYLLSASANKKEFMSKVNKLNKTQKENMITRFKYITKNPENFVYMLINGFHSNKESTEKGREYVNGLVQYMEKNKLKNMEELSTNLLKKIKG
ncbi:MAG: hypothetical protein BV459_00580 [Thermoplasmata archaeon M11B2D]|nr:MAG: hypothetical protein BV459_00580 [Thermoplasmata archaeon M11B2D]